MSTRPCLALASLLAACTSTALAAEPPVADGPRSPVSFRIGTSHLFPSDVDDSDGDVSRTAVLGDLAYRFPPAGDLRLGLSLSGGLLAYDFGGDHNLTPTGDDPWDDVYLGSVGVNAAWRPAGKWSAFGALNLNSAGEGGADFGQTLTAGAIIGVAYTVSPDLTIGVGAIARTRLEDNPVVVAFPTVRWRLPFDDQRRWTFELGGASAGPVQGAGATLSYAHSREWTFSLALTGLGVGGDFRLEDDGPVPGGVGRDFSLPLVLGANWTPRPGVRLSAFAGVNLFGKIEVLDADGDEIADRDLDPAPILGISLAWEL